MNLYASLITGYIDEIKAWSVSLSMCATLNATRILIVVVVAVTLATFTGAVLSSNVSLIDKLPLQSPLFCSLRLGAFA